MPKETAAVRYHAHRQAVLTLLAGITTTLHATETPADGVAWGDVGDMDATRDALQALSDRLHGTGEYAR